MTTASSDCPDRGAAAPWLSRPVIEFNARPVWSWQPVRYRSSPGLYRTAFRHHYTDFTHNLLASDGGPARQSPDRVYDARRQADGKLNRLRSIF